MAVRGVISFEGGATVECAGPVALEGILGANGIEKVAGMLLAGVLHAQVVDYKGEGDRA